MHELKRSDQEIEGTLRKCSSKLTGLNDDYVIGIMNTIDWLTGNSEQNPMEEIICEADNCDEVAKHRCGLCDRACCWDHASTDRHGCDE